jgi:hypothetical protein
MSQTATKPTISESQEAATTGTAVHWGTAFTLEAMLGIGGVRVPNQRVSTGTEIIDVGTRVRDRTDVSHLLRQTTFNRLDIAIPVVPSVQATRMTRILGIAPLSRRRWAEVFGVSPNAIQKWTKTDPPQREKLGQVLGSLERASLHHADLANWLVQPVGRTTVTPLDLLRNDQLRGFLGAVRTQRSPAPEVGSDELLRRRRNELPWAVQEPASTPDE